MAIITENEYGFTSTDRVTQIHVHEWLPEGQPRAVVQIAHGIAEYIERYGDFARFLAADGIAVVGHDHLGHGRSLGPSVELGFFAEEDGWFKVVDDIEKLRRLTAQKFPGVPYFLFGHSMGSFLTRSHLIRYPAAPLTGVVLSGTGQNPAPVVFTGLKLCEAEIRRHGPHYVSHKVHNLAFGTYNKGFAPQRTNFDWLSRDEASVDKYMTDPLCGFVASVGLYRDLMTGLRYISDKQNLARMNKALPLYLMSGDADPVGANGKGVRKVYSMYVKSGMEDVCCRLYPGGRHEMLNEQNRAEVYQDVLTWINSRI